jgi:hypothetical protein
MKPLPDPRRCSSALGRGSPSDGPSVPRRENRSASRELSAFAVASIFTTATLIRAATSAKLTTLGPDANAERLAAGVGTDAAGAVAITGAGENSLASIRPSRNATDIDRAIVTRAKRFDIFEVSGRPEPNSALSVYYRPELLLREHPDTQLAGFVQFAAGISTGDEVTRLSAHRA